MIHTHTHTYTHTYTYIYTHIYAYQQKNHNTKIITGRKGNQDKSNGIISEVQISPFGARAMIAQNRCPQNGKNKLDTNPTKHFSIISVPPSTQLPC